MTRRRHCPIRGRGTAALESRARQAGRRRGRHVRLRLRAGAVLRADLRGDRPAQHRAARRGAQHAGRRVAQRAHRVRLEPAQPAVDVPAARAGRERASGRGTPGGVRSREHDAAGRSPARRSRATARSTPRATSRSSSASASPSRRCSRARRGRCRWCSWSTRARRRPNTITLSYTFFEVEGSGG